jgi:hypothetical protein
MTSGQNYEGNIFLIALFSVSYYGVPHLHDVSLLHVIRCFVVKTDTYRHK